MNKRILNKAISIARLMENDKQNICTIITDKKNKILSIGCNSYKKTSPLQKKYAKKFGNENKEFNHSEIDAIRKLPYGKKPYAIYVARVNKFGKKMLSKPCKICSKAIEDYGIKEVYYTRSEK